MLDPTQWADIGPWGLLTVFVMLVLLGGLVPRWIHSQRVSDRDKEIALLRTMLDKRDEQFDKLVKQGEITIRLLEDIKRVSVEQHGGSQ